MVETTFYVAFGLGVLVDRMSLSKSWGFFFQPKKSSFYWGLALPWRMVDSRLGLGWLSDWQPRSRAFLLYLEKSLGECFCLLQMFKECTRMMCFSSICCYHHSFSNGACFWFWKILYGDYLSGNIQDVGRHPHSLSLKRKLQTGVVAIPLQGLQISWSWNDQQKTSSWWYVAQIVFFKFPTKIKGTKYIRIKAWTCCCPQNLVNLCYLTGQDQDLQRQAWFRYLGKKGICCYERMW